MTMVVHYSLLYQQNRNARLFKLVHVILSNLLIHLRVVILIWMFFLLAFYTALSTQVICPHGGYDIILYSQAWIGTNICY